MPTRPALFACVTLALVIAIRAPEIAAAAGIQDLGSIRAAAEKFIRSQIPAADNDDRSVVVSAGYLDPRLRLQPCAGNLTVSRPVGDSKGPRTTVAVACKRGADWTVYVPVTIETESPVLVTRKPIVRGASLTAEDVETQVRRVPGLATEHIAAASELSGRHAKRAIPAGTALTVDLLATDLMIKRGQLVTLLAAVGGIEVRATGRALNDGGTTDRIRVQNLASAQVVEGRVESADIVRIAP